MALSREEEKEARRQDRIRREQVIEGGVHPAIAAILKFFEYEHLPETLRGVSRPFCELAHDVARELPSDPETTVCLRKLLEAKDCAVRAALGS